MANKADRSSIVGFLARWIAGVLFVWLLVSVGLVVALRFVAPPVTAMMLEQPVPLRDVVYSWRNRGDISASVAHAVIASEDQRFIAHHGIDFKSLDAALDDYRAGDDLRGASTITQQVAKNLFLWPGRSFARKALEVYFALLLETFWSKQRILEVYLNVAELGSGVFGVEAAAQRFFGTHADALSGPQAAVLAAVLPNPRALHADRPSAYVRGRQAWILSQMALLESRGHYRGLDW
jgi:monofunctional biosynthetic peptidoglycan transglycosylase